MGHVGPPCKLVRREPVQAHAGALASSGQSDDPPRLGAAREERSRPLKLSTNAFWIGLPGWMQCQATPPDRFDAHHAACRRAKRADQRRLASPSRCARRWWSRWRHLQHFDPERSTGIAVVTHNVTGESRSERHGPAPSPPSIRTSRWERRKWRPRRSFR